MFQQITEGLCFHITSYNIDNQPYKNVKIVYWSTISYCKNPINVIIYVAQVIFFSFEGNSSVVPSLATWPPLTLQHLFLLHRSLWHTRYLALNITTFCSNTWHLFQGTIIFTHPCQAVTPHPHSTAVKYCITSAHITLKLIICIGVFNSATKISINTVHLELAAFHPSMNTKVNTHFPTTVSLSLVSDIKNTSSYHFKTRKFRSW